MGSKFPDKEHRSSARMERAAPWGKAGGLGGETTLGGGRERTCVLSRRGYRLYCLSCPMTPVGWSLITWGRERLGRPVPERKPSSGSQDCLRRVIVRYINTKRLSADRRQASLLRPLLPLSSLPTAPSPPRTHVRSIRLLPSPRGDRARQHPAAHRNPTLLSQPATITRLTILS